MFRILTAAAVLAFAAAPLASAQSTAKPNAVKRTTLQSRDFPGATMRSELIRADVAPGGTVPRHTHPGLEIAYIEQGHALVKIAGEPDRTLQAGGSFSVLEGTVHSVTNTGPGVLTILSTYVVDKSKPLVIPAP